MKAYKIQGACSDTIFYVGFMKDVEKQLREFFDWQSRLDLSKKGEQDEITQKIEVEKSQIGNKKQSKRSQVNSSYKTSLNSSDKKHLSIHFLLYDLQLHAYNDFQSHVKSKFSQQLSKSINPISIHFVIISSREQSLRYIKKIDKFNDPEFQSNLIELYEDLNQGIEYELIKGFIQQKFGYQREEVFEWLKSSEVNKLQDYFGCQSMPNFQKKQVRRVLTNLTILEQLYAS